MKAFDGREKSLLRAAARDVLPTEVAERVKSPYPSTMDPGYDEAVRSGLRTLLADRQAPVLPLLDTATVAAAVDELPGAEVRAAGEVVLQLDAWLRMNDVAIEV
jgi:asparagine synthase (glutamine-hydrolysing)